MFLTFSIPILQRRITEKESHFHFQLKIMTSHDQTQIELLTAHKLGQFQQSCDED